MPRTGCCEYLMDLRLSRNTRTGNDQNPGSDETQSAWIYLQNSMTTGPLDGGDKAVDDDDAVDCVAM